MWLKIKLVFISMFHLPFHNCIWYLLSLMVHFPLLANCLTIYHSDTPPDEKPVHVANNQAQNLKLSTLLYPCFKPFTTPHLTRNRSGLQGMIPNPFISCLPWLQMPTLENFNKPLSNHHTMLSQELSNTILLFTTKLLFSNR